MVAGLHTKVTTGWDPWAKSSASAPGMSELEMMRSRIGSTFAPAIWRPAGTIYLRGWLDHWRRGSEAEPWRPVWGLLYVQQTLNKPIENEAAYRCVRCGEWASYENPDGTMTSVEIPLPVGLPHTYWVNGVPLQLRGREIGRPQNAAGGGGVGLLGLSQVLEYYYDSAWVAALPADPDSFSLQGYCDPGLATLNPSDIVGTLGMFMSNKYSRPSTVTDDQLFVTG